MFQLDVIMKAWTSTRHVWIIANFAHTCEMRLKQLNNNDMFVSHKRVINELYIIMRQVYIRIVVIINMTCEGSYNTGKKT